MRGCTYSNTDVPQLVQPRILLRRHAGDDLLGGEKIGIGNPSVGLSSGRGGGILPGLNLVEEGRESCPAEGSSGVARTLSSGGEVETSAGGGDVEGRDTPECPALRTESASGSHFGV